MFFTCIKEPNILLKAIAAGAAKYPVMESIG
jgi:hypothetical protein